MNKKTVIFYFSQSGNSLYVAKRIAELLGNTTLVSIPETIHNNQYNYFNYDKIGFVIPLYFMSMPIMVNEFISNLKISKDSYVFSIITKATSLKGRIFYDIDKVLRNKKVKINYGEYLTFPDSYIKWTGAASEIKCLEMFQQAENSFDLIADKLQHKEDFKEKEGFILKLFALLVYSIWKSRLKIVNKSFKVNNNCIGCGVCEKTCPSRNIRLEEGKPIWSNKCQDCMACVQHCSKKAIYFNAKTIQRERYINPNIKMNELLYKK